jgi:hypothetical protein
VCAKTPLLGNQYADTARNLQEHLDAIGAIVQ